MSLLTPKSRPALMWLAVAIMLPCTLVAIFIINPEAGGYAGGNNAASPYETFGLIGVVCAAVYLGLIWRS